MKYYCYCEVEKKKEKETKMHFPFKKKRTRKCSCATFAQHLKIRSKAKKKWNEIEVKAKQANNIPSKLKKMKKKNRRKCTFPMERFHFFDGRLCAPLCVSTAVIEQIVVISQLLLMFVRLFQ